jgi:NADPH2:quinone reductase
MRAVRLNEFGDPSVLGLENVTEPETGPERTLIDVDSAGVNFGDVLVRQGLYFGRRSLPVIPGWEVVGKVVQAGPESDLEPGERVVALLDGEGYADRVAAPTRDVVRVPDSVDDHTALAMVIQGATAWRLLEGLTPGDRILVSGAGSGVTRILVQLARQRGAGSTCVVSSSEEKAERIRELGADETVLSDSANQLDEELAEVFGGGQADLVIDMVGGEVFEAMLRRLRPGGRAVVYGVAGGTTVKVSTGALLKNGWTVSGLWLGHSGSWSLEQILGELFSLCQAGKLVPTLGPVLPLGQADEAHRLVEARSGVGKVMLDCRVG